MYDTVTTIPEYNSCKPTHRSMSITLTERRFVRNILVTNLFRDIPFAKKRLITTLHTLFLTYDTGTTIPEYISCKSTHNMSTTPYVYEIFMLLIYSHSVCMVSDNVKTNKHWRRKNLERPSDRLAWATSMLEPSIKSRTTSNYLFRVTKSECCRFRNQDLSYLNRQGGFWSRYFNRIRQRSSSVI